MGYTHYYDNTKELDQETWDKFIKDVKTVYNNLPKTTETAGGCSKDEPLLLNGCGKYDKPHFAKTEILFNGEGVVQRVQKTVYKKKPNGDTDYDKVDYKYWESIVSDLGHETFHLQRKGNDGGYCKTARKPYDLMVTCVLTLYARYFKTANVSSDGNVEDWQCAFDLIDSLGLKRLDTIVTTNERGYPKWNFTNQLKK
jgi:hypothetical protein